MLTEKMKLGTGATNGELIYVPIPKNATMAHCQTLIHWDLIDFRWETQTLPAYAPIRHPVDRWFAGVKQYAKMRKKNLRELLDRVEAGGYPVLDEHTVPQTEFLLSTLPDVTLVKLENAADWVKDTLGESLPFVHSDPTQPRNSLVSMVEDFYAADFELYERAA